MSSKVSYSTNCKDQHITFPLDSKKYKLRKLIGRGSTATVYAAQCITNNEEVAIKLINLEVCPLEIDSLRAEIAFWSTCDHPNVVRYYGSFVEGSILYIIMEYMNLGSISEIIKFGFSNGIPKENVISAILKDILEAISYFHANHKIHRDIKTGNVLVNQKGEVKIGDFGIAASLVEQGQRLSARYTVIGTPCYMAPEVIVSQNGYSEKADIWSLGITAIELATGSPPYSDLHPLEVIVRISDSAPPSLPEPSDATNGESSSILVSSISTPTEQKSGSPPVIQAYSQPFRDFVRLALQKQPEKRPSAIELLGSKFIKMAASQAELAELFSLIPSIEIQYDITHQPVNLGKKPSLHDNQEYDQTSSQSVNANEESHSVQFSESGSTGNSKENKSESTNNDANSIQILQKKPDGIKAEWDFSGIDENNNNTNVSAPAPAVFQKGKFTITKRTTSTDGNAPQINQNIQVQKSSSTPAKPIQQSQNRQIRSSDDQARLISDLKARILYMKNKINSLKNENIELRNKIENLSDEVQKLNI